MRLQMTQIAIFGLISSCYSTPADISSCVGSDVNIPWEYPDNAGMSAVSWEHSDASNVKTTILLQFVGTPATVIDGYNIQHSMNGDVTITNATVDNSGTYRITVTYNSATPTFTDDVDVNVYDPPKNLNFTESPSGSQTTFTCTADSLGDTAANLYIQVNGVDQTSSVSATVSKTDTVKCILSGFSVQCMSGVSGTKTSICVQCPQNPEDCQWWKPRCWPWLKIVVIIIICILVLILIGIILGCFLIKTTCCCDCFYKGECCEDCKCEVETPCGACSNIECLPYWYQVLWASIISSPVAFGIWLVWRCCNNGKSDKYATLVNIESTSNSPKKAESKLPYKGKQRSASGNADGGNKGKQASDTQIRHDKSQNVNQENEETQFRLQPPPPTGAKFSDSSNPDKQKTGDYRAGSDLPAIPGADKSKPLAQNPNPLPPIKVKT